MLSHFPENKKPRDIQIDAITRIDQAFRGEGKRFFTLDAPTGSGKSAIADCVARCLGTAFITTPQNILLSQYTRDCPHMHSVMGKANYDCTAFPFNRYPAVTDCDCLRNHQECFCPPPRDCETADDLSQEGHKNVCEDYVPLMHAFWGGPLSVTNLSFLYWARRPDGSLAQRSLLVVDEVHGLESWLIQQGRVGITPSQCQRVGLGRDHFSGIRNDEQAEQHLIAFQGAARKYKGPKKEERKFRRKADAIELALDAGDWIYWADVDKRGKYPDKFVVSPMRAQAAATKLFSCADHVLLMSATVGPLPLFLKELGIPEEDNAYYRIAKSFPVENRMVEYYAVGNMGAKHQAESMPDVIDACKEVVGVWHPHEKGLILCPSYPLQEQLYKGLSEFKNRLITHKPGDRAEAIQQHCDGREPTVLLGVAMSEGLDLIDNHARFLIIPKVPYPNLGDPHVKGRMNRDATWYDRQTATALIQGVGRVVRTPTDHAKIYVFDTKFWEFIAQNENLFPAWFLDAICEVKPEKGSHEITPEKCIKIKRPHKVKSMKRAGGRPLWVRCTGRLYRNGKRIKQATSRRETGEKAGSQ